MSKSISWAQKLLEVEKNSEIFRPYLTSGFITKKICSFKRIIWNFLSKLSQLTLNSNDIYY